MAQKVNIVLVDDIDGSDASETVSFALDGASYEIDLNAANAAKLRDALATYVGHARKVGGRRPAGRRGAAAGGPAAKEVRAWARDNGYDLPDRGRIPADAQAAYAAAH
jgi:hypothetical protein